MDVLSMKRLGFQGRFGNQICQYIYLKRYCSKWNLRLQTPNWPGRIVFDLCDDPIESDLPVWDLEVRGHPMKDEMKNHDFCGLPIYGAAYYKEDIHFIRYLFRPSDKEWDRLWRPLEKFVSMGETRIGIHLRRGDCGQGYYYKTPVCWFLDWLKSCWNQFSNPILFIATEDRSLVPCFSEYNPMVCEKLGVKLRSQPMDHYWYQEKEIRYRESHLMDFFPDWFFLSQCEILLVGVGTYAMTAAIMNPFLREFWRSDPEKQSLIKTDLWSANPMGRTKVDDLTHIRGIRLGDSEL